MIALGKCYAHDTDSCPECVGVALRFTLERFLTPEILRLGRLLASPQWPADVRVDTLRRITR